jgi:drug/metabolite transporter, DME family
VTAGTHGTTAPAVGPRHALAGAAMVAGAGLLWAAIGLFATPLLDRGMSPAAIAFWRAAIGGVCFLAHGVLGRRLPRDRNALRLLVAFGVVGVGVFYTALPAAIDAGGVSLAWLLLYTAPAWVALAAPVVLRERVGPRTVVLVVLTVVGVVLVALGGGDGITVSAPAVGWGLTAGLTYATWYLVSHRACTGPIATGAVAIPVGAVVLAPAAVWPGTDLVAWACLLGLGVASTYLAVTLYYAGLARLPATRAAVIATVEPVAALVLAWALFDERLGPVAAAGSGVVVVAAVLAALLPPAAVRGDEG